MSKTSSQTMAIASTQDSLYDLSSLGFLQKLKIGIVTTEWNRPIVDELRAGAEKIFQTFDVDWVQHLQVPGCIELTYGCKHIQEQYSPQAIIAFGAVIRGGTPHFDYVCQSVTWGITQLNLQLPCPVIFGVLTLNHEYEAWERLGGAHGHKGEEAAICALKMIALTSNNTTLKSYKSGK